MPHPPDERLQDRFERLAREPGGSAANCLLAAGHSINWRERDTPDRHVLRRHPDGTVDLVQFDLTPRPDYGSKE